MSSIYNTNNDEELLVEKMRSDCYGEDDKSIGQIRVQMIDKGHIVQSQTIDPVPESWKKQLESLSYVISR